MNQINKTFFKLRRELVEGDVVSIDGDVDTELGSSDKNKNKVAAGYKFSALKGRLGLGGATKSDIGGAAGKAGLSMLKTAGSAILGGLGFDTKKLTPAVGAFKQRLDQAKSHRQAIIDCSQWAASYGSRMKAAQEHLKSVKGYPDKEKDQQARVSALLAEKQENECVCKIMNRFKNSPNSAEGMISDWKSKLKADGSLSPCPI